MPVSTTELAFLPDTTPTVVVPCSGASEWVKAIESGGLDVDDIEGEGMVIQDATWIDIEDHSIILERAAGIGTVLWVRLQYDADDDPVAEPLVIRVFAAHGADPAENAFVALTNHNGDASVPIHTRVDDDSIFGAFKFTTPDNTAHAFDCKGYTHFLIGIEKVYLGESAGTTASLSAMIV